MEEWWMEVVDERVVDERMVDVRVVDGRVVDGGVVGVSGGCKWWMEK